LQNNSVKPEIINSYLEKIGSSLISQKAKLHDILLRPNVFINDLAEVSPELKTEIKKIEQSRAEEIVEETEILIKYNGYIEREKMIADKIRRLDYIEIHKEIDYNSIQSLSTEARQKLTKQQPKTIGQASRISGISPNDINVLLVLLGR
jgi:tRNA uridine 5-carboxymethylaminomethyl modification enzyme